MVGILINNIIINFLRFLSQCSHDIEYIQDLLSSVIIIMIFWCMTVSYTHHFLHFLYHKHMKSKVISYIFKSDECNKCCTVNKTT